ncbi:MAG: DJ-1/PfpI family protein [Bacteroidales bacterium]|nr:DJ-1/PfpI family protein [Bacteroidales bacterium]
MEGTIKNTIKARKVAFLVANGVKDESLKKMKKALTDKGAMVKLISLKLGTINTEEGNQVKLDGSFLTEASVLYDAVYIPDGKKSIAGLMTEPKSIHFVNEAYKHCKAIATGADGVAFLKETFIKEIEEKKLNMEEAGVITDGNADKFIGSIAKHRFWNREEFRNVPA